MSAKRGSFLVVCLSLMILMVVIALAALHEIRHQVQVSTGNERYLLVQAAARTGLDHAMEQILTDYNSPNINVRSGSSPGGIALPAITFLDGQYRAPFCAIYSPNDVNYPETTSIIDNDVRAEDYVLSPWAWWWFESRTWWNVGMYDGKGRYYEPGYYNATIATPGMTAPVVPTPFADPNAALPERTQAVFYDDQFCRVKPSGNPQQDRRTARYRLRYTVGVEDLSGHMLINPIPDMQMLTTAADGTTPLTVDYRTPEVHYPWMTAATNVIGDCYGCSNTPQLGAQLEHVFKGRGYQTNIDLDHSRSGLSGTPVTFPLSYRNHSANGGDSDPGVWSSWIDNAANGSLTTNLYWSDTGTPRGLAKGGEAIPNWSWNDGSNFWPYNSFEINHCLMGPQLSFDNLTYASQGERAYLCAQDGGGGNGWPKFGLTPFGRCLTTTGYKPTGPNKWYQGRVDTPFYLNLMTAPPAIINSVLMGYLPPREKLFQYSFLAFYKFDGVVNNNNTYTLLSRDLPAAPGATPIDPTLGINQVSFYGKDLLVDTTAPPAFKQWPAPDRVDQPNPLPNPPPSNFNPPGATGIGQYIKPDYFAVDSRSLIATYPGVLMNGDHTITKQAGDDLGLNMDEQTLCINNPGTPYGLDIHDQQSLVNPIPGIQRHELNDFNTNGLNDLPAEVVSAAAWGGIASDQVSAQVPSGWGTNPQDMCQKSLDPNRSSYSYFYDMLYSMAVAISVFRASYVQYDNTWIAAANIFQPGDQTPEKYQTLRDLDRVFLAEMGESLDAPGSGYPAALKQAKELKAYHCLYPYHQPVFTPDYVPENNILSLVQQDLLKNQDNSVTSIQRGHVMELLLNDFRMSFMGSSPGYSDVPADTTKEFRPLDFDGDGNAYCSCYSTVDADGLPFAPAGTKPGNYFTITGNFFVGKSHFYRIFSRGEIWDNLLNIKVNDATLDSVVTVDPEGTDPSQTQFLYQRWFYNRYLAMLPRVQR
jgi:hypothetical protein